jgi:dolichyl-phosphate-mannose--protein O-mannosyl transferase
MTASTPPDHDRQEMFSVSRDDRHPWYFGLWAIFIIGVVLRFWGLGRFNEFVFDEVYYAKFANNYLTNTPFFNAHPPLSQYIIAIGIWLGDMVPIGRDNVNELTGSLRSTFSYRWMNAVWGSFIPVIVAALGYQLTSRWRYAFLAGLVIAIDGLFLVDSRYALNNIFLVLFGILGQLTLFFCVKVKKNTFKRYLWGFTAAFCFGSSVACKWNGLWFLLAIYILLAFAWLCRSECVPEGIESSKNPIVLLSHLNPIEIITYLAAVPFGVYSLWWLPHLSQNPQPDFWKMQWEILHYHEKVGNGPAVHPYCADWYTWPLMLRPMAYYYKNIGGKTYLDVHAMGNPFLWWFSFAAISIAAIAFIYYLIKYVTPSKTDDKESNYLPLSRVALPVFFLANYAASLLPWVRVTRCLYIYHYMGALVFATMGFAWIVDISLSRPEKAYRALGITAIAIVVASFIWWMPIYLGLPLDGNGLKLRMWFRNWI